MEKKEQPLIVIKKTGLEKILDSSNILIFILFIMYFIQQWISLPNHMPIHYNFNGEPDRWGEKWVFWIPIAIGILLWIGLSILEKYPHSYNYFNLTLENAERQYKNARIMLNIMKTEITIFILYVSWMTIEATNKKEYILQLPVWIFFIALFVTIGFSVFRSLKLK